MRLGHGTRRERFGSLALLALLVLGTTLAATNPGDPTDVVGGAADGSASAGRATAVLHAPSHEHRVLAVRRHGADGLHWRVGLVGVLVAVVALVGPGATEGLPGRRNTGHRPGRGRLAPARAPPVVPAV